MINIEDILQAGDSVTVTATGRSMTPTFIDGRDKICITPCDTSCLRVGDVVFFFRGDQYCLHRIVSIDADNLVIRGDGNSHRAYERVRREAVVGIVVSGTMLGGRPFKSDDPLWTGNTRRILKYHFFLGIWHKIKAVLQHYPLSIIVVCSLFYLSFFKPSDDMTQLMITSDKLVHVAMYLLSSLVFWMEWMSSHRGRMKGRNLFKGFLYCLLFPIALGGAIELGQEYLTEYRGGEWLDFAANSCGAIIATFLSFLVTYPILKLIHKDEVKAR